MFPLNEPSEYTIIFHDRSTNGSFLRPSKRYFLTCLITLFVIFISSVWNLSVTCERMLSPARISRLVCVIHERRCRMERYSLKDEVLKNG